MREIDPAAYADLYANNYSAQENQKFTADFGAITDKFRDAMLAGTSPLDPLVQDLVGQHYNFILQFWKPSQAAYKSLAMSYILPSPYRDSYEAVAKGLGQYHYDAIVAWANANLE